MTLPHLVRSVGRGEVAHLQMTPSVLVTALTVAAMRRPGALLAFSPHNTFARHGGRLKLRRSSSPIRLCGATIAFSDREAAVLSSWKGRVVRSPLVHIIPVPEPARVERFRGAWDARNGRETVLFAGQIRRDKRLDLLIESATSWPPHRTLAVVGETAATGTAVRRSRSAWACGSMRRSASSRWRTLVAAIVAADVVVAPYDRASQSGVLLLAGELGVRTVAADLGGLAEQADSTFPAEDVDALTAAVDASLRRPAHARRPADVARAREAHLAAYALAREHAGAERQRRAFSRGYDYGSPAADGYEPPLAFNSTIRSVTYDVLGEAITDDEAELGAGSWRSSDDRAVRGRRLNPGSRGGRGAAAVATAPWRTG